LAFLAKPDHLIVLKLSETTSDVDQGCELASGMLEPEVHLVASGPWQWFAKERWALLPQNAA